MLHLLNIELLNIIEYFLSVVATRANFLSDD
jgi:hypothetical protein